MVPVPFHQQLMGSCMLRISKEHNAATSDEGSDFFLCWDRFEVVRPSRLFSFYSSLTTNVSGSLLSAEDIQVWYFLYDVWHLLLFCKHWQPNLSALFWLMSSLGNLKFISRNMYQMRGPTYYPQKNRQLFPKNFPQRSWSSLLKDDQQVSIYSFIHHDNFSQHFTYSNDSIYYEKAIYVYYRV